MSRFFPILSISILSLSLLLTVFSTNILKNNELGFNDIIENEADSISVEEKEDKGFPAPNQGCLVCHQGIEPIRAHESLMMQQIYTKGATLGDPNGCIVCHQGNPNEVKDKTLAHKEVIEDPGSIWALDRTCGQCHQEHQYNIHRSLMQTEAGKIQGATWGWQSEHGYQVYYGNYDLKDPDGAEPKWGTPAYKEYMHAMREKYPTVFPDSLVGIPETNVDGIGDKPQDAVFTYLRGECLRCHVGVKGKQRRGDYRGMGCSACHIPYSDEGRYEGNDRTISKEKTGHMLVHSIQSSRKAKVKVNGITYSGIPTETCTSCHNRGKRIGMSYTGLMESAYNTSWNEDGSPQHKLHGKNYHYIQEDVHHRIESREGNPLGGLLCQDCHTTTSMHGDGNIAGTTLGQVEVECADCHGIPEMFPWELPLGYQDEFDMPHNQQARGVADHLLDVTKQFSTIYDKEDGYLLSARGNPFGNIVRRGSSVVVHSASGKDFITPTLKELAINNEWKHPEKAITAMLNVGAHIEKMECYACHSEWAPQCYGCHIKVDFTDGKQSFDWIKAGRTHDSLGYTAEFAAEAAPFMQKGKVTEGRSFLRWEDPVLGVNGEGRVTPIIPGCQQITTVIGTDGKAIVTEKIWRTLPNLENGGEEGRLGIDMTPVFPHTTSAEARDCESCHTNPKTLGYGIGGGNFMQGYDKDRFMDIKNADGQALSKNQKPQISRIENLSMDLSQVVTRDGKQLQTVGHHWPDSGPLSQDQRERMERVGVCIACHKDLPDGDIAMSVLSKTGDFLGLAPHGTQAHMDLLNSDINWAARTRLLAPIVGLIIFLMGVVIWRQRKRLRDYS